MKQLNNGINSTWASNNIDNTQSFTPTQITTGIEYKADVVSNQLNGALSILSKATSDLQVSGTYYISNKNYSKGDLVSIKHQDSTHPLQVEFFEYIGTTSTNQAPLINATLDKDTNTYTGGTINTSYWRRISQDQALTIEVTSPANNSLYLMADPASNKQSSKYSARMTITYADNYFTYVEFDYKVKYINNTVLPSRIGTTCGEVGIHVVESTLPDGNYNYRYPLGVVIICSSEGKMYLKTQWDESAKAITNISITVTEYSDFQIPFLPLSLAQATEDSPITTKVELTIRPNGGYLAYNDLGKLQFQSSTLSKKELYMRGLVAIDNVAELSEVMGDTYNTSMYNALGLPSKLPNFIPTNIN